MISSLLACILTGLPRPSLVQSTLENDGITEPTWCCLIAGTYGESASLSNSLRRDLVDALVDRVGAGAGRGLVVRREPVAGEVLGAGEHPVGVVELAGPALEAVDDGLHRLHQPRRLAEALVGAAPAVVAGHADARRERPLRAGGAGLLGGDVADPLAPASGPGSRRGRCCAGRPWRPAGCRGRARSRRRRSAGCRAGCRARPPGSGRPCRPRPRACCRSGTEPPPESTLPRALVVIRRRVGVDVDPLGLGHLADLLRQRHPAEQVG